MRLAADRSLRMVGQLEAIDRGGKILLVCSIKWGWQGAQARLAGPRKRPDPGKGIGPFCRLVVQMHQPPATTCNNE
jgi:hypothetical protein